MNSTTRYITQGEAQNRHFFAVINRYISSGQWQDAALHLQPELD
jgi:hypothetical protein